LQAALYYNLLAFTVQGDNSVVRIHVGFASILDTTAFTEKRT